MFTNNWYNAISAIMSEKEIPCQTMDGTTRNARSTYCFDVMRLSKNYGSSELGPTKPTLYNVLTTTSDDAGVIFGTGNTQPQLTDIALSGDLVTGFGYSVSLKSTTDDNGIVVTATYTITNNSSKAVTIGEVAIIANIYSTTSTTAYKSLLERTALANPITISANGGVGQITYNLRMNYPE